MKALTNFIVGVVVLAAIISGCKKKANPPAGGLGGTATLVILPQHHGISKNIDTCKVYIRYNSLEVPPNNIYDDSAFCTCANGIVTGQFSNLRNGDYHIMGYGYDSSVFQNVTGGIPITIAAQNATTTVALPINEIMP